MTGPTTVSQASPAGIVADDLTGATDSAVQFARDGWKVRIALSAPASGIASAGSIVAMVTDARAQTAHEARERTAQAVIAVEEAGAQRLFVKIDSTMRGAVDGQIRGALESWASTHPEAIAVVCPAYPAMGRTVDGGRVLVHGAGVHTTAVGNDPVTPVTTSRMAELLPGSTSLQLDRGSATENAARIEAACADGTRVVVVDAVNDADLALLAASIGVLGPRAIPVGAAGLAVAMSRVWSGAQSQHTDTDHRASRVVVVVSSLHDVSRDQAAHLQESLPSDRVRVIAPTLDQALNPSTIAGWTRDLLEAAPLLPEVVVIASPHDRPMHAFDEGPTAAERIAESLATITEMVVDHDKADALMLLGGEGARAVLDRIGAKTLLVHHAIREGIPRGTLEGGAADGMTVVTKAGGFGTRTSVTDIVLELLDA